MISEAAQRLDPLEPERILVVTDESRHPDLLDTLRGFYPEWNVVAHANFLSAIADLARRPARAVLTCTDTEANRLEDALGGRGVRGEHPTETATAERVDDEHVVVCGQLPVVQGDALGRCVEFSIIDVLLVSCMGAEYRAIDDQ